MHAIQCPTFNTLFFIYMQCKVHYLVLIYTIFMYMQFNALLIHCLLFLIPFNVYNYIYYVCLHMYYSAFMAANHNKTIITKTRNVLTASVRDTGKVKRHRLVTDNSNHKFSTNVRRYFSGLLIIRSTSHSH